MDIGAFILQAIGVFVAVMAFVVAQNQAAKKSRQTALDKIAADVGMAIDGIKKEVETEITKMTAEIAAERANRAENINRLHLRIDEMQKEIITDLQQRLSNMEGSMKGMSNVLDKIYEWFIGQAGKPK